jgi:transposase
LLPSEITEILGGWEGYTIKSVHRFTDPDTSVAEIWIYLQRREDIRAICSHCGDTVDAIHDYSARWVRDLPILDARTMIFVPIRRVACPRCGPCTEALSWVDRYCRFTVRLAQSVHRMCQATTIRFTAQFFALNWKTVKAIDKRVLEEQDAERSLDGVRLLAIDEFAIQKGHRYATVVFAPRCKRVLWVGRGRGRADIRPFFTLLGTERCRDIDAVVIDMNASYELEIALHCPQARIVYDLFHVLAKYGREVIDRVRVDEANRLRDDRPARKLIKGARWLLLRNRENITSDLDRVRLKELLAANHALTTVYILKDDLKQLWQFRDKSQAARFWKGWNKRAEESGIVPLQRFARNMLPYIHGILAHCAWPLHTSVLEGVNNKIKVIKRMAYGYRDDAYFFLRIKAAFPGIGP